MDTSSQRKILRVSPSCEISQLAGEITSALVGDGPTLGFGEISSEYAPSYAAVAIGTSGTTGGPKEVLLTSTALISSARASNKFIGAQSGDTWSLLLPLTHIAAVNVIVRSMELGTTPIDLRDFVGEFPKANYTAIVPTQLFRALNGDQRLLNHLRSTKAVLVGGAALSERKIATQFLGARTPIEAISAVVKRSAPPAIFLWAQLDRNGNTEVLGEIPSIRPAPRVVLGGPGWDRKEVKSAVLVDDLLDACEEIMRAVGA